MSTLVIVESPTKAKTISKFLGKEYRVESSFGHIRDLPKSTLGIDVDNNFEPKYLIPIKARKTVTNLKSLAKKSDKIILATDEDREGEAIAWHLSQALDLDPLQSDRIVFHEITKNAILNALKNPRHLDLNKVNAQQARRILDRIVGYKLSPFLWKKIARRLSAGRVQSVAVRLVVEREKEIRAFKSEEYWTIKALLQPKNSKTDELVEANLVKIADRVLEKLDIKNQQSADQIVTDLRQTQFQVSSITKKEVKRHPLPPFITSTLQQTASSRLSFSAKKTMFLAQKLYENGHITYMRTDSVNLSADSAAAAKSWLADNLGAAYSAAAPRFFKSKTKGAQEAHEAIRPSNPSFTPESFKGEAAAKRLYDLIWRRFMASQMPPALFDHTSVEISAGKYGLKATGNIMKFDGFLKVWADSDSATGDKNLPDLEKSDILSLNDIQPSQHFTEPPPRYNEASLVKTLEEYGIGRPSTYAPIISVIEDRGYVNKEQGRFIPTPTGESVNDMLTKHFPQIVDINFTATMENSLDAVAEGREKWQDLVGAFYKPFITNLENKYNEVEAVEKPKPEETGEKCELCGKPLIIRSGRFGKFIACSGFPECKNTKKIAGQETTPTPQAKPTGLKCPDCQDGDVVERFARKRRKSFWGCSRFPKCKYATWDNPLEEKDKKEGK